MSKLHNKLWKVFSEYIRLRDATIKGEYCRCYSCNAIVHWKECDAGHYEKRQYMSLLYDERNVHSQCRKCNRFEGGRQSDYAIHLIEDYGQEILKEFSKAKWIPRMFTDLELMGMIEEYKIKVKELKNANK